MKSYGGLIRWKFGLPLALGILALVLYTFLLLDQQLRWLMEKLATDANGAEVNIGSLKTSISGLYIEVQKVQMTDPEAPEFNRLEVDKMRFDLGSPGLLRGKVIIEDATMQDIQIHAKRARPGRVLPPPPPEAEGLGALDKTKDMLNPVKDEVMANAMNVLKDKGLVNPLKDINWEDLPSRQAIRQIEGDWNNRQQMFQGMIGTLPKPADFQQIKAEASAIKPPDDPTQIQATLANIDSLKAKAQAQYDKVDAAAQQIKNEGAQVSNRIKILDELVKQDIAVLSQKLKLPDLDFKNLAEEICGPEIKRSLKVFEVYYAKVKPYLESKEKPAPSKPLRLAGTDVSFPDRNGLPAFWLKKMQISSKETAGGPLGDMLGKVTDLSSTPALVPQPTMVELEGNFQQLGIQGLKAEATLDHRKAVARDVIQVGVASFPVADRMLTQSQDYALGFYKAQGGLNMNFILEGDQVQLEMNSMMKQLSWKVEAQSERIKALLDSVFGPMTEVRIAAKAQGPWQSLQWNVTSNLADHLRQALRQALSKEIAAMQDQLKQELDKRMAEEKGKLEGRMRDQLKAWESQLNPAQQEAEGTRSQIDAQKNQLQSMVDAKKAEAEQKISEEKKKQEEKAKDQIKSKLKIPGLK
ncbi:MAG TPA: TIGR03545 family protein [Oligoflexus sp.]|uniref:TIGR03545 family protein n=1 Tax=Oligoflexus sp. TaxID=1971216 RepID=UPI002D483EE0|nr:TIGR03545 family protein [Oligoflexus sp.]HYX34942.1 TIGR03545 family protein [Oligoflexus sp.]